MIEIKKDKAGIFMNINVGDYCEHSDGYFYEVPLANNSYEHLVYWISHLNIKTWFNKECLCEFMMSWSEITGNGLHVGQR